MEGESIVLETPRLRLRRLTEGDYDNLCGILQDKKAMYAYEHAFSDEEVRDWLDRQFARYRDDGFGLWAVCLKDSGEFVGQCGITMQQWGERTVPEIGYLFRRDRWGNGYASEAARACRRYAFDTLGLPEIFSIIRHENTASRRVAERNGMEICGEFMKHYCGLDIPHLVYGVKRT